MASPTAKFFKTPTDFRKWLIKNHTTAKELMVGFYKVNSGQPSITWPQSVDEALCFGWIDGIRRSIDEHSYSIRFTPRRINSIWSPINLKKIEELKANGLMTPAGLAVFEKRNPAKDQIYLTVKKEIALDKKSAAAIKKNKQAYTFFKTQIPSYQKAAIHWVMGSAKAETREKRLQTLIKDSEAGLKIKPLRYGKNK